LSQIWSSAFLLWLDLACRPFATAAFVWDQTHGRIQGIIHCEGSTIEISASLTYNKYYTTHRAKGRKEMTGSIRWRLILLALASLALLPLVASAANLLTNGNFASFSTIGRSWNEIDEKVGTGWDYFYVDPGTQLNKLHWFSSTDFTAHFNPGGDPYELEGPNGSAQNMWSAYEFDAGIYQRVTGLTIGTVYAFDVPFVTFWRGPGYPDSDGIMKKRVGIDPTGGTDPTSPDVIWSEVDSDDKKWVYMDLAARAEAEAMTFFVRIEAPDNHSFNHVDLDMVYIDAAKVDLAPTASLNLPGTSTSDISFSWTGSAAPDWSLKGVEVQYRDEADGIWQIHQGKTGDGNSSYTFTGQAGHTYTVRVRPWQTTVETYNDDIDMPGLWIEKSVTVGGVFAGYVRNNFDAGVANAQVSTTGANASSGPGGYYALQPPTYGTTYALTASASGYQSPPPIAGSVADQSSVTTIDFTLKPANDAITNGDFETGASGWNATGSASIFNTEYHSGSASLKLLGDSGLSQTANVSGMYNPTLSFWYKPDLTGANSFEISLQGSSVQASKTFTATASNEWQHVWLPLDVSAQYDGPVGVTFHLSGDQVLLDEVSLGDGPHPLFLPLILASATP
jgi:hypothetical protein